MPLDLNNILFHCRIEVEKHLAKKNNRPIYRNKYTHRVTLGKSSNLKMQEHQYLYKFRQEKIKQKLDTITTPVQATMLFYFPKDVFFTKKGTINKNLPDLSNLYELPQDCLTTAGVIYDDQLIFSHDFSRRLYHDKDTFEFELILKPYDLTQDLLQYNISPLCSELKSPRKK